MSLIVVPCRPTSWHVSPNAWIANVVTMGVGQSVGPARLGLSVNPLGSVCPLPRIAASPVTPSGLSAVSTAAQAAACALSLSPAEMVAASVCPIVEVLPVVTVMGAVANVRPARVTWVAPTAA